MLEQRDLEMIAEVVAKTVEPVIIEITGIKTEITGIKTEITGIKTEITGMKTEITGMKAEITGIKTEITGMKAEIAELKLMDQFILDEIGREHELLTGKIDKVQQNLDEISQYYKITKLENDNTTILLRMINGLSERVEILENKGA